MDLSLVIACYLDAPHLKKNTLALHYFLKSTKLRYEFIFVNDASPDQTRDVLKDIAEDLTREGVALQILHHEKNQGRGAAVMTGMKASRGTFVGFIDIDLEHLPDAIPMILCRMQAENIDVVLGQRLMFEPRRYIARSIASLVYRGIAKAALGMPFHDTETGLKIFRREKIVPLLPKITHGGWFWDTEIVHRSWKSGLKVVEHPIVFQKDLSKQSTVKLFRDSWRYLCELYDYRRNFKP